MRVRGLIDVVKLLILLSQIQGMGGNTLKLSHKLFGHKVMEAHRKQSGLDSAMGKSQVDPDDSAAPVAVMKS